MDKVKARTEKATVRFLRRDEQGVDMPVAQGVLVPDGFIITAAHCIDWDGNGAMALGDHFVERIRAGNGVIYTVSPYAVEPMRDIAALAAVDGLHEECNAFEEFCEATEPVPVSTDDFPIGTSVPVHVLTHRGAWVTGRARRYGFQIGGAVAVEFDAPIESGTSGGPVIDDNGLLVGVVSQAGAVEGQRQTGLMPRPHLALPVWIRNRIVGTAADSDED
jgi:S1-C subfamily serine protease